jgi:extracellular elastinolytic metalloproteinase
MRTSLWILSFISMFINLEQIRSQDNAAIVEGYLLSQVQKNTISEADIENVVTSEHVSKISNVQHVYFSQTLHGIQIVGTNSSVHQNSKNEIISESNHFIKGIKNRRSTNSNPVISPLKAIDLIANQLGYEITESLTILSKKQGASEEYSISSGGISFSPIPAKLKYFPLDNGDLELVWEIAIQELDHEHWWDILVSATTGKIIKKDDFVVNCSMEHDHSDKKIKLNTIVTVKNSRAIYDLSENIGAGCAECYEVIKYPLESPLYGERTVEIISANLEASPLGWHDTDGIAGSDHTVTKGNNVNAFDGGNNYGYQPDGGPTLNFSGYSFSQVFTEENQYEDAAITNLFYWVNILHDLMYVYGFDEKAGNFQEVNYSASGRDKDSVLVLAQNDARECNASFASPIEGFRPQMKIDVCGDKDGAFDNVIVIHEFAHGISNRLVGGGFGSSCLRNEEHMGEGWSDWYALMTTMKSGDSEEIPRGIATYYRGFGTLGGGVRKYPYTTDITLNPLTYNSIKTAIIPHGVGAIWSSMLWEMTWGLINRYGFDPDLTNFTGNINQDAGNVMALAIVTEALKLTPCSPGFVDARDAILTAAVGIYGDSMDCVLWPAFAKRGLGRNAFQGDSEDINDGIESFEIPPTNITSIQILRDYTCDSALILTNETGGLPFGGTYSGPGVTDNGDGWSYTFDASMAGIGTHSITYSVPANLCRDASFAMDTIEIFSDTDVPFINCPDDYNVSLAYGLSNYTITLLFPTASDNCTSQITIRQNPEAGTVVGLGITPITFYATDASGNESSSCTVALNVEMLDFEGENVISVYPNPMQEGITVQSKINIKTPTLISIIDINGRLVSSVKFDELGFGKYISTDHLNSGVYFMKIEYEEINIINRLIRY